MRAPSVTCSTRPRTASSSNKPRAIGGCPGRLPSQGVSTMSGVFCNQCGHRNPSGSNFCSSCGAALEVGEDHTITFQAVEAPGEPAADDALTVSIGELPEGLGMLVVKRGPNAGSKYVLEADVTTAGRHPDSDIFLDDITVSRRHAEFARVGVGLPRARRRVAQRDLRQPRADRGGVLGPRRRGADRQVQAGVLLGRRGVNGRALPLDRAGPRPAQAGVPRPHHLQDPVPREPGAARSRADAVGIPQVLRARRRAAPLHPAGPAGAVPAAEGDQGPARPRDGEDEADAGARVAVEASPQRPAPSADPASLGLGGVRRAPPSGPAPAAGDRTPAGGSTARPMRGRDRIGAPVGGPPVPRAIRRAGDRPRAAPAGGLRPR